MGCVTPYIYILIILLCDPNGSPAGRMLAGFCMGLAVDIFAGTPGAQAASLTLLAYIQPSILRLFMTYDRKDHITPGALSMGWGSFSLYAFVGTLLFVTVYTLFRITEVVDWMSVTIGVALSTLTSLVLMLFLEIQSFRKQRRRFR